MFYPNLGETKNKPVAVGTRGPGIGHPEAHPPHLQPSLSLGLGLYTHITSGLVPRRGLHSYLAAVAQRREHGLESGALGTSLLPGPLSSSLRLCFCSILFPRKSPPATPLETATLPQHARSLLPALIFPGEKLPSDMSCNLPIYYIIADDLPPSIRMQASSGQEGNY